MSFDVTMARVAELQRLLQPPGSNDAPRIAEYRTATAGSGIGPWCNYFVSWIAKQAGAPLGEQGQGFGAVAAVWDWAQRTGKTVPAGQPPQPGDLIVWDGRHIGIVESVDPSGQIHTIEGNSSDRVSRRTYGADGGGATSARSSGTTATKPQPMLKTSHISATSTPPRSCTRSKMPGTGRGSSIS